MSFLAFAIAAVVHAITPGPGVAYVVARTIAGGRSEGVASCFGTGIGGMLHVLAAALGLSLIVAQSAVAYNLVKYLGAAYLVYMGIRLLLRKDQALTVETVASQGVRHALLEGVIVEAQTHEGATPERKTLVRRLPRKTWGTTSSRGPCCLRIGPCIPANLLFIKVSFHFQSILVNRRDAGWAGIMEVRRQTEV